MSLLDLQPHKVSRNLRGYSVFFYGQPKSGKTTIASKFPKALILAFEKGYNALPGVFAQPINSWGEFKKLFSELKTPEVHEKFETIVIDTADIAYSYCEKFICNREGVDSIGDIPYGKGYALVSQEFDESIRKILNLDYGLVLISHSKTITEKNEKGQEVSRIVPTLDNRGRLICERTCDIIGYSRGVEDEAGNVETRLFLRGTPSYVAGSRFKYVPTSIEFTYENLVKAISDAIDKQADEDGGKFVTDEVTQVVTKDVEYNFDILFAKFQDLVGELMSRNQSYATKITAVVDKYLGKGKKVNDCTEEQAEQLDLIVHDLEEMLK